ncbi:hypothetical protein Ancab_015221 [Ancistrocladus abbreviatus]
MKVISKPSYIDVVHHAASNQEGKSQTLYPLRMGSHKGSRDFQGESFPYSKPMMKKHGEKYEVKSTPQAMNSEEPVKINDEPRRAASPDKPSDSLDIDGANHEKGMEEHVGMANLINDKSSLFSGATA